MDRRTVHVAGLNQSQKVQNIFGVLKIFFRILRFFLDFPELF
jgi:hypothetical protein